MGPGEDSAARGGPIAVHRPDWCFRSGERDARPGARAGRPEHARRGVTQDYGPRAWGREPSRILRRGLAPEVSEL
jgi:hypothetical protein